MTERTIKLKGLKSTIKLSKELNDEPAHIIDVGGTKELLNKVGRMVGDFHLNTDESQLADVMHRLGDLNLRVEHHFKAYEGLYHLGIIDRDFDIDKDGNKVEGMKEELYKIEMHLHDTTRKYLKELHTVLMEIKDNLLNIKK